MSEFDPLGERLKAIREAKNKKTFDPLGERLKAIREAEKYSAGKFFKDMAKGAGAGLLDYGASLLKLSDANNMIGNALMSPFIGEKGRQRLQDAADQRLSWRKYLTTKSEDLRNSADNKIISAIGEIVADPLNLAPGGLIKSGTKAARAIKSGLLGGLISSGSQAVKDAGKPYENASDLLFAGGVGGGANAIISLLTKGKGAKLGRAVGSELEETIPNKVFEGPEDLPLASNAAASADIKLKQIPENKALTKDEIISKNLAKKFPTITDDIRLRANKILPETPPDIGGGFAIKNSDKKPKSVKKTDNSKSPAAPAPAPAPAAATAAKPLNESLRKRIVDKIKDSDAADWITGAKLRNNKEYMEWRNDYASSMRKGAAKLEILYKSLSQLSINTRQDLHRYLTGENVIDIPPAVRKLGDSIRKEIIKKGQNAVDLGILSKDAFEEWRGIYLHRTYEPRLTQSLKKTFKRQKTVNKTYSRGKEWTGSIDDLKSFMEAGRIGRISDGKISFKENKDGSVTFRRDYTPEERAAMNEITDGAYTIADTLARLNDLVYTGVFLDRIANETGIAFKTFGKNGAEDIPRGWKTLSGRRFGALNGYAVPKEIYYDLVNNQNSIFGNESQLREMWQKYLSLWKKTKTVYDPASHFNNIISNATLMIANGMPAYKAILAPMKSFTALKKAAAVKDLKAKELNKTLTEADTLAFRTLLNNPDVKLALEAEEIGVFGGSRLEEMLSGHGDAGIASSKPNTLTGRLGEIPNPSGLTKISNIAEKAYQGEDNSIRLGFYSYLRKDLGLSAEEALKGVRSIVPDYTRPMSQGAMFLRNTGIVPFVSWTYHILPTLLKNLNPLGTTPYGKGLNKYNAYNMLKMVGAVAAMERIMGTGSSVFAGLPLIGEYFGEKQPGSGGRIGISKDAKGNVRTLKIDKWFPHADIMRGSGFISDLLTGGIPQKLAFNLKGRDPQKGYEITQREGLPAAYDYGKCIASNYLPIPQPFINAGGMLESALIGKEERRNNKVYNPRTPNENLLTSLGINVSSYNADELKKQREKSRIRAEKKAKKEEITRRRKINYPNAKLTEK